MNQNLLPKLLIVFSLLLIASYSAMAQQTTASKTDSVQVHRAQNIFVEAGAAGLFFSVNYDSRFLNQRNGLGARLGVGYWQPWHEDAFVSVPLQVNYLFGKRSHFLEIGAGATYLTSNGTYGDPLANIGTKLLTGATVLPTSTLGYRYQPVNGGINIRASFNPILYTGALVPYFGASAGYTFK
jgi:hypothetical protein